MSKSRILAKKQQKKLISDNESGSESENEEYEVEKILDRKQNPKTKTYTYQVKWKGWDVKDATWEPASNLQNVKDMVKEFDQNLLRKESNRAPPQSASLQKTKEAPPSKKNFQHHSSKSAMEEELPDKKEETKKQQPKRFGPLSQRKKSVSKQSDSDQMEECQEVQKKEEPVEQFEQQEENEFVFEEILSKKLVDGENQYLIKFSNSAQAQWIMESQLDAIKEDIQLYENKLKEEQEQGKTTKENLKKDTVQSDAEEKFDEEEEQKESKKKVPPSQRSNSKKPVSKRFLEEEKKQTVIRSSSNTSKAAEIEQPSSKKNTHLLSSTTSALVNSSSSLENSSKMASSLHKRQPIELNQIPRGDFKTDNVDRIELQGEFGDILSSRFEIFWKTRKEGTTPSSSVFSASYLRRYEPNVLIDFLVSNTNQNLAQTNHDIEIQQAN